jgi:hypothetical protein
MLIDRQSWATAWMGKGMVPTGRCLLTASMDFVICLSSLGIALAYIVFGASAHAEPCPTNAAAWQVWRDRAIETAFNQVRTVQGRTFIDYKPFVTFSGNVRGFGEDCFGTSENFINVAAALRPVVGNFFDFFGAIGLETDDDHQFGMTVDDAIYVDEIREVIALPPLLTSQDFLRAVSDRDSYRTALDLVNTHNALLPENERWIPLIYKSRFLTTPDDSETYGRLFVLVPGETTDKWIQFGILTPEMENVQIKNLSIVAVRRLPGHSPEAPRTETFIVDYWRGYENTTNRDGENATITVRTKFESGMGTENCSDCHKTPVLGIHPAEVYRFDALGNLIPVTGAEAQATPDLINSFIENYGPPNYRGWQLQVHYGPAMGPIDVVRPDSFFNSCTVGTGVTTASYGKLRKAMNCAACHNEALIGRINFPLAAHTTREFALVHPDTGAFSPLVETYVLEGWMPPGIPLDENERMAVVRCLQHEYLDLDGKSGLLIDWLKRDG